MVGVFFVLVTFDPQSSLIQMHFFVAIITKDLSSDRVKLEIYKWTYTIPFGTITDDVTSIMWYSEGHALYLMGLNFTSFTDDLQHHIQEEGIFWITIRIAW